MRRLPTGEPVWDLQFDEGGRLTAPAAADFLDELIAEETADLFVFSNGWGTSDKHARGLYESMFPMIRDAASGAAGIGTVGFAGIYWPSLWFPPTPATPPPRAGSTQIGSGAMADLSAGTAAVSGADIAESLRPGFADQVQQEALTEIGRLIDEGEAAVSSGESDVVKQQRLLQIHQLLRSLVPAQSGGLEDSGEYALLLTLDPMMAYPMVAWAFGSALPDSTTQGIGDWFGHAINGAKDAVRVLSYTIMKARAGDIGQSGLGPLLAALHGRAPAVRVHLIGHSFGARLVSFALSGVGAPADSPVASLLLLQGAFSHWAFAQAQGNPFGSAGALNAFADRVHGPLVATFSVFDWAVGLWYPKASFLARQDAAAVEDDGRWDGMGADGYQAVSPVEDRVMTADGGTDYGFTAGTFYRVNAASVINDVQGEPFAGAHSDIRKPPLAKLAVDAAAAHE